MADKPSSETKDTSGAPAPETLKAEADNESGSSTDGTGPSAPPLAGQRLKHRPRGAYRPSHKATFIGLAVVVLILAINAGVIAFVLKGQSKNKNSLNNQTVSISQTALDKLGVNQTPVGDSGIVLNIGPDTVFGGNVKVAGNASITGQLKLNSTLSASDANFSKLNSGSTAVSQLNVNGDATASNLTLRNNLTVSGNTILQGNVSFGRLVTINNNLNVVGSLAVGGTFSAGNFQTTNLTVGGHFITAGYAPTVSKGSALASTDTVTLSGDDAAGTVAVNIGYNSKSGIVANVYFHTSYSNIPHVVITPIGPGVQGVYVERTSSGFSIGVSSIGSGGHAFDYIVEQ